MGARFEQNVKYKARLAILNTNGQAFQRTRITVDQNYQRDHSELIMKMAMDAGRMQDLARRDRGEKYFIHIEVPGNEEAEDEMNSWINAIANSQLSRW